ncbi:dihydrolipoyl dehydrogenase [Tissierella carlieri]|uniref:dihydrolipoyl dehydrogenase n=1 Tax=Tissierella carlieri TaxID=689904 RepID=UPI001C0FFEAB|nr:dihydrolipoyl dehydrogenase [Tissierella carlieri]MBU5310808.1 dihydrolipoyl dehydrogenase [Tissierella carlieri]
MILEVKFEGLNGIKKGKVTKIYKKPGDSIDPNTPLLAIEVNKTTMDLDVNVKGVIKDIKVKLGANLKLGDILAVVDGEEVQIEKKEEPSFDYFKGLIKPKEEKLDAKVAIIGSGPGGYVAAIRLAQLGADVILVEKDSIGGTCLNRGCIPTKSLVKSADVFKNIKESHSYGCKVENYSLDINEVISRKNQVITQLGEGISHLLEKNNIKFVKGSGEILDKNTVFVKTKYLETTIKAEYIIIATGSTTSKLPIPGIDLDNVLGSTEIMEINELPKEMVVIGGGVIGMEFSFIFNTFGTKVSVVEFMDRLLPGLDEDVSQEIEEIAENKGISIYTGSKVEEIIQDEKGRCIITFTNNGNKKYLTTDKVLISIGRQPYLDNLGINKLDMELNDNRRGIKVNEKMMTSIPNIFAVGDATGTIQLAHIASTQGVVAANNIMGIEDNMNYNVVPSAIFTDPEIASVGISEKYALDNNMDIEIGKFPIASNGKALTLGVSEGFVKIIVDKSTKEILGASIVGPNATDLINEISIAMTNKLKVEDLTKTIHPHPTTSEAIFEALLDSSGICIHN